jgi:hypothetical protein
VVSEFEWVSVDLRSKIRRRAAAALGITAIAIGSSVAYEELANRGADYIDVAMIATMAGAPSEYDNGGLEWKTSELSAHPAATATFESAHGPVSFHFNQSDEIAQEEFDPHRIPLFDAPVINTFTPQQIRKTTEALDALAATQVGQEMLSTIASDLSGNVQISRLPDDASSVAMGRTMVDYSDPHDIKLVRDESHDIARIALRANAIVDGPQSSGGLAANGRYEIGDLAMTIMHELAHATIEDTRAVHVDDAHGFRPAYEANGEVRDLALHAENRLRREMNGQDPNEPSAEDNILYSHAGLRALNYGDLAHDEVKKGQLRANLERYGHLLTEGFELNQIPSPAVSSLGGLRLSDEEFEKHAHKLAYDALNYTGGAVLAHEKHDTLTLSDAYTFLEDSGAAESEYGLKRRLHHEVESALRIENHRAAMKDMSIDGTSKFDARIDEAARTDPELAVSLFEQAVHPDGKERSIAATRDIVEGGVYAKTKAFLVEHDEARRAFAQGEADRQADTTSLSTSGKIAKFLNSREEPSPYFRLGADAATTQAHAMVMKQAIEAPAWLLARKEQPAVQPTTRTAAAAER